MFIGYYTSCYLKLEATVTMEEARKLCQQRGGDLVAIETEAENNYVGEVALDGKNFVASGVSRQLKYSDAPQYRMSRDQQILSFIGGFSLLPL